ncbi:MAG: Paraquat-inducible protein A [Alteromonadaceae bacterium]|uniref:Paraquat-inducible membrane protein PqiA family n=1 Tax=Paraglaciecola chathamensis TaxID=368405 RepID=A0A8H9LVA9_9ALTE|nr:MULTISPECIES: paraquat-inducible protein A [Paraglaciecola]AEE21518.1 Paraquat-inducible protein A [Glaciecola sp. 4H-3-7+YE-5]MBN25111.1 Paraquat-inducible protein A [Alteromonadaceae bacterium]MDO6840029.1 paraquat-inducible protein A [Paraglaciecola chathamensis]GGZ52238.1 paraquat-inducible membrane protein PqiA family [Paraglaciecola oceanifecundans]
MKQHVAFALNIIAIGLFIPGITLPMFALNMEMSALLNAAGISSTLIDKELSILNTVQELWEGERFLVAALIFLFSVCVPILKTILMSLAYFTRNINVRRNLSQFVSAIGKWSMADVFVVAVFLAILSTNHADTLSQETLTLFGFTLGIDISTQTLSAVGDGFFYFVGYCLLSLLASHIATSPYTLIPIRINK